jgi:hypothetical protein
MQAGGWQSSGCDAPQYNGSRAAWLHLTAVESATVPRCAAKSPAHTNAVNQSVAVVVHTCCTHTSCTPDTVAAAVCDDLRALPTTPRHPPAARPYLIREDFSPFFDSPAMADQVWHMMLGLSCACHTVLRWQCATHAMCANLTLTPCCRGWRIIAKACVLTAERLHQKHTC